MAKNSSFEVLEQRPKELDQQAVRPNRGNDPSRKTHQGLDERMEGDPSWMVKTEEGLRKQSHDLAERIKELNCLYGVSKLISKRDTPLEDVFRGVVELIPPSWQYPDITCARITFEKIEFKTPNFSETTWKQSADIMVSEKKAGAVEVYYLKERPEIYEGPFLKEERDLINAIAREMGVVIEGNRAEEKIRRRTHDLGERVKELNCLYGMSKLLETPGIYLEEILQGIVDLIPPSWQYPEITCARAILEDRSFLTKNFRETIWKQSSDIIVNGQWCGEIDVCYLKEQPQCDEGPFLKEERALLKVITERLGKIIERMRATEALLESEERYRILTEHVADGVSLVQDGRILFANDVLASMFGFSETDQLFGKAAADLISNDFKQRFQELHQEIETGIVHNGTFRGTCISMEGREFWIEGRYNIIKWKGKPAVLGTIRDITETKLMEMAMQEEAEGLRRENIKLKATMKDRYKFGDIIGKSPAIQEVYELIMKASASEANVVIYGESGTGKELIARTIHDMNDRRNKTFVPVNCGAIPETLFESEFFGHRKGAFTGAYRDKHGFFDLAHGGTLFLDEVGELDPNLQAKLLRAIEGGGYMAVGDNKIKRVDARIVAATNRNLADMVKKGLMREDFFYRIHIIPITVPPLRNRKEDIPLLVDHFLRSHRNGKKRLTIPGKIMDALCSYDWPGNVREIQNVLHRYFIVGHLDFMDPSRSQPVEQGGVLGKRSEKESLGLHDAVEGLEKTFITRALKKNHWNRSHASEELGISRKTLFRKMKSFGLA